MCLSAFKTIASQYQQVNPIELSFPSFTLSDVVKDRNLLLLNSK